MQGRVVLDVVVGKGLTVLEIFALKNETLSVWWAECFVLELDNNNSMDLGLDALNRIGRLDHKREGLACRILVSASSTLTP